MSSLNCVAGSANARFSNHTGLVMPGTASTSDRLLELAGEKGILRSRDAEAGGISRKYLSRLVERGDLVRIGRGLYQRADHEVTEHHSLAVAAKQVPKATTCLLSALEFHGLTTQGPFDVWIAIGHKDRRPSVDALSLRVARMSGEAHTEGIEEHEIEGVSVPIYEPAKTVADCFKYRSRVGWTWPLRPSESTGGTAAPWTRFGVLPTCVGCAR